MEDEFQGRNLIKRKYDVIFLIIPLLIIGLIIFHIVFHIRILSIPVTSDQGILDVIVDAALDGKRTLIFKSTMIPSEETINNVFPETFNRNKNTKGTFISQIKHSSFWGTMLYYLTFC